MRRGGEGVSDGEAWPCWDVGVERPGEFGRMCLCGKIERERTLPAGEWVGRGGRIGGGLPSELERRCFCSRAA